MSKRGLLDLLLLPLLLMLVFNQPLTLFAQSSDDTDSLNLQITELTQLVEDLTIQINNLETRVAELEEAAPTVTTAQIDDSIGKRSNPVPFGDSFTFEFTEYGSSGAFDVTASLSILSVIRGQEALDIINADDAYADELPSELEWAIVEMQLDYLAGSEDDPYSTFLYPTVFDVSGKEIAQDYYAYTNLAEFNYISLFPGAIHTGYVILVVPQGEDAFDLVVNSGNDTIFFATE